MMSSNQEIEGSSVLRLGESKLRRQRSRSQLKSVMLLRGLCFSALRAV
jgi:hypothetical protein